MSQPEASTSARRELIWRVIRSVTATVVVIAAFVAVPPPAGSSPSGLVVFVPVLESRNGILLGIRWGLAVIALIAGVIAIRGWLGLIFSHLDRHSSTVLLRNLGTWALYACLVLALLTLVGVNLSGLLVGGAIFGVIIGAAAQSSLGNFFSGILLMLARPFEVGVTLRIRTSIAGMLEFEGTVADTNALFTTLRTTRGELLRLPNQVVMNSALTVGKPPLQGTLQATLPAGLSLTTLRTGIRDHLGDRGADVIVTPISLAATGDASAATVVCQIDVRSRRPLEPGTLTEAVVEALAAAQQPA